ncbi:Phosphatase and actin regulator, partial [Fasciola gigantica]
SENSTLATSPTGRYATGTESAPFSTETKGWTEDLPELLKPPQRNGAVDSGQTLWQRLWQRNNSSKGQKLTTRSKSTTATPAVILSAVPSSKSAISTPTTPAGFHEDEGESVPCPSMSNVGFGSLRYSANHPARHEFKITHISPQSRHLLRDLRASCLTNEIPSLLVSPYDQSSSDPKNCPSAGPYQASKFLARKSLQKTSKAMFSNGNMKMRFVRVVRAATSVPDLSKEPVKSAMKSSRNSSQCSLNRITTERPRMSASPIARNSDSLSLSPPSPERMIQSEDQFRCPLANKETTARPFINTNPTVREAVRGDHSNLVHPVTRIASCSLPLFTCSSGDTSFSAPALSGSPTFGRRSHLTDLFGAAIEPRKSEGSPILLVSGCSENRFTFRSQLDTTCEVEEVDHLTRQVNEVSQFDSRLDELEHVKFAPSSSPQLAAQRHSNHISMTNSDVLNESDAENETLTLSPNLTGKTDSSQSDLTEKLDNQKDLNQSAPRFHNLVLRRDSFGMILEDGFKDNHPLVPESPYVSSFDMIPQPVNMHSSRLTMQDDGGTEEQLREEEEEEEELYVDVADETGSDIDDNNCYYDDDDANCDDYRESSEADRVNSDIDDEFNVEDFEMPEETSEIPIVEVLSASLCAAGYGRVGRFLDQWLPQRAFCESLLRGSMNDGIAEDTLWERRKSLLRGLSLKVKSGCLPTTEMLFLRFTQFVEVQELEPQDRVADKPWTRLTASEKAEIRRELNDYKWAEMSVHQESRQNTRFHLP